MAAEMSTVWGRILAHHSPFPCVLRLNSDDGRFEAVCFFGEDLRCDLAGLKRLASFGEVRFSDGCEMSTVWVDYPCPPQPISCVLRQQR
ncbi:hypothetical protein AVEN_250492-1 [Araneus ventricosus]|uniref:Uncharacterized protein n=1 Tax=Araneus ventricosus TaxID=182803 RepID=A0A4Y2QVZ7_ARAVE|nr:hypothetical protein AVEN_250492-1 [Araneus ventricosus]